MPLDREQLEHLKHDLKEHEKALRRLETGTPGDEREARRRMAVHRTVLEVARNPRVLDAVGELHDHPERAAQLDSDPQGFLRARGVELPAGATRVGLLERDPDQLAVGVDYLAEGARFRLEWGRAWGFRLRQLPGA